MVLKGRSSETDAGRGRDRKRHFGRWAAIMVAAAALAAAIAAVLATRHGRRAPTLVPTVLAGEGLMGDPASKAFGKLNLVEIQGGQVRTLVPGGAKNPDVNRAGTAMVFERFPASIWLMPIRHGRFLTESMRAITPPGGGGWSEPSWLPDGRTVLVTHGIGGGHHEIFTIDTVTGATRQITDTGSMWPWKFRPRADPSGQQLVVTYGSDDVDSSGPHSHVGTAPLNRGMITGFTSVTPVDPRRPSYDGDLDGDGHLIFDAGAHIWLAGSDGSGAHSIAAGPLARFDPEHPGRILYLHDAGPPDTVTEIWSAKTDGTDARPVAVGNFAESFVLLDAAPIA